uniref:Ig-like domain-containing protein n=1 Tax=Stegastes partitus TaxID=144197 RepID=A0A3B4Z4B2_9TELE
LSCVFLHAGQTAVIETQQTVVAAAGGEAQLNCQLLQSKEVLEVTWQKVSPGGEKSLSSSHKVHGTIVNPEFKDKIEFIYTGLQSCSMIIRNTTEQDEGCYRCLFITYSGGSLTATTCLQVYGKDFTELH